MKNIMLVVLLMIPVVALGQYVFHSPFTQTFPTIFTSEIEEINRRITIEPNTITIATDTEEGKEIEVLVIQSTDYQNENIIFLCENGSRQKITIVIPEHQEQIEVIDYYYYSPKTREETQLRFHVEQIK